MERVVIEPEERCRLRFAQLADRVQLRVGGAVRMYLGIFGCGAVRMQEISSRVDIYHQDGYRQEYAFYGPLLHGYG